jgi:hypothetical protein
MLAKIRKLLALAEDAAATEQEAETYTAKAAQLIADYGIDQALLAAEDPSVDPVGDRVMSLDAPFAIDKGELLSAVAVRLRCRAVTRTRRGGGPKEISVHLFGHSSDLERVELLFTSLLLQAATALTRTPVPGYEHKAAFRRSWLAGFRMAVARRLDESEARAEADAGARFRANGRETGLVLADRTAQVESAVHETYPHLRTAAPRSLSGSGIGLGWTAGQRADLGARRVGTTTRPISAPR